MSAHSYPKRSETLRIRVEEELKQKLTKLASKKRLKYSEFIRAYLWELANGAPAK
jgi:predicted DNA binding CopG/RHH family protein